MVVFCCSHPDETVSYSDFLSNMEESQSKHHIGKILRSDFWVMWLYLTKSTLNDLSNYMTLFVTFKLVTASILIYSSFFHNIIFSIPSLMITNYQKLLSISLK